MQLDAVLCSLWLYCQDIGSADVKVLHTTSDAAHEYQYIRLMEMHPKAEFIREHDFKQQLLSNIAYYPFVFFAVDDCMFVKPFLLKDVASSVDDHQDAWGFSLRLGRNTTYCNGLVYSVHVSKKHQEPDFCDYKEMSHFYSIDPNLFVSFLLPLFHSTISFFY